MEPGGWRARIGHVAPSGTIELPGDWDRLLPDGTVLIATTLGVREHTQDEFRRALERLEPALDVLVGERADVICAHGTPLSTLLGYAGEQQALRRWSERVGVPVGTAMSSIVEGCRRLAVRRAAVATPYKEEINDQVRRYLADAGLDVVHLESMPGIGSPADQGRVPPSASYGLGLAAWRAAAAQGGADGLVVLGRFITSDYVVALEEDLGVPVLASNPAGVAWALHALGRRCGMPHAGRLMAAG